MLKKNAMIIIKKRQKRKIERPTLYLAHAHTRAMHRIVVSKLSVRVNGYAKLQVRKTHSLNVLKGCLTLAHRELNANEVAELYNTDHWQVMFKKHSALAGVGHVLEDGKHIARFQCSGTRYVGSDLSGMSLLGLHFSRRVCHEPSAEVVEALLDCGRPGAGLAPRAGILSVPGRPVVMETALDFCHQPTRNAFASLYHYNKKAFKRVSAACTRTEDQVHAELVLVAMLYAGIVGAEDTLHSCGVRGQWCAHAMQLVGEAPDLRPTTLSLSVKTAVGVLHIEGFDTDDAFFWRTPLAGLVLAVPKQTPGLAGGVTGNTGSDILGTVQALRAAAAGRLAVHDVPYVRARPCIHGASPWEATLSLLCNAHSGFD